MKTVDQIKNLHIEFSSKCNARCPLCPRNLNGYPYNFGYKETSLTLDLITNRFSPEFIKQLTSGILINGNFGDFTANLESISIIQYFIDCYPDIQIKISTNGSARSLNFWYTLGKMSKNCNIKVEFALDGLENTHHLYRQDTNWNKILENAQAFMSNGTGYAIWKMIKFDHNLHQIEDCRELSQKLGFNEFLLLDGGRDYGWVLNRDGTHSHNIGNLQHTPTIEDLLKINQIRENPLTELNVSKIDCLSLNQETIYIAADGKVYPCCFLGFNPETYRRRGFIKSSKQIANIMYKNDLHEFDLLTCIEWFSLVKKSWEAANYEAGRLSVCDNSCGKCDK